MHCYPVFLDLSGAVCLVVGTGAVGRRKIEGLLRAGAETIRVLALPGPNEPGNESGQDEVARALLSHPAVRFTQRAFEPADVEGCRIVCAAANDPAVNAAIAEACRARNVLCTVADAPELGSCITPISIVRDPIRIGLSTGGASPALAQRIKTELEVWLADRYDAQITLLARLRPLLLRTQGLDQAQRAAVFHQVAAAAVGAALAKHNRAACAKLLQRALPPDLHSHISELLHELV